MPAQTSSDVDVNSTLSLVALFQSFSGLAAAIVSYLDQDSKKKLRACSRACKAAVNPLLTRVAVSSEVGASVILLQSHSWHHLQELCLR
jgi:hypothetical protein